VALGAQHVQAADLADDFSFGSGLLLDRGQFLMPCGLVLVGSLYGIESAIA
jgi:hypothetical protein